MNTNQKGFSVLEAIFIVVIIGLLGLVGWYVYDTQAHKTSKSSPNNTQAQANVKTEEGDGTYRNDALGLSFSYPPRWGKPETKTREDDNRFVPANGYTEYDITFPNAPLFFMPIINNKNNYLVQHAGCFNAVGLLQFQQKTNPNSLKLGEWRQSEADPNGDYTTYDKMLINDTETVMVIDFEVSSVVSPQGYCNGLSVYGFKNVKVNSKNLSQLQFIWSKTASTFGEDQPELGIKDLEDFKQNQSKYISDQDLKDLQATIESIKTY